MDDSRGDVDADTSAALERLIANRRVWSKSAWWLAKAEISRRPGGLTCSTEIRPGPGLHAGRLYRLCRVKTSRTCPGSLPSRFFGRSSSAPLRTEQIVRVSPWRE